MFWARSTTPVETFELKKGGELRAKRSKPELKFLKDTKSNELVRHLVLQPQFKREFDMNWYQTNVAVPLSINPSQMRRPVFRNDKKQELDETGDTVVKRLIQNEYLDSRNEFRPVNTSGTQRSGSPAPKTLRLDDNITKIKRPVHRTETFQETDGPLGPTMVSSLLAGTYFRDDDEEWLSFKNGQTKNRPRSGRTDFLGRNRRVVSDLSKAVSCVKDESETFSMKEMSNVARAMVGKARPSSVTPDLIRSRSAPRSGSRSSAAYPPLKQVLQNSKFSSKDVLERSATIFNPKGTSQVANWLDVADTREKARLRNIVRSLAEKKNERPSAARPSTAIGIHSLSPPEQTSTQKVQRAGERQTKYRVKERPTSAMGGKGGIEGREGGWNPFLSSMNPGSSELNPTISAIQKQENNINVHFDRMSPDELMASIRNKFSKLVGGITFSSAKNIFRMFDSNSKGSISFGDFVNCLQKHNLCSSANNSAAKNLFKRWDLDRDGVVSFSEFLEALIRVKEADTQ